MSQTLIHNILANLIESDEYARKVLPFLKKEYFQERAHQVLFDNIYSFFLKYNSCPTKESLQIMLENDSLDEETFESTEKELGDIFQVSKVETLEWLLDETEKFCQERAIFNALMESIAIAQGESKTKGKEAIPEILKEALGVSFDTNIGHDFLEDYLARYDFYHNVEEKIPFDIEYLNKITCGGLPRKTLNLIVAPTGFGKTAIMCHFAASYLSQNKNVLYISMEMSQEKISERIDANLLNTRIQDLKELPKASYEKKMEVLRKSCKGKLIVREYPTSSAHVGHFRHLLHELELKKNFRPDVIFVDYLNICASARVKGAAAANMYSYVKSIAEEVRGLGVEFNVPIISATQVNRDGIGNSDPDLKNTSESMGLSHTCDLILAAFSNEELEKQGKIIFKQLKNRYNDMNYYNRFVVGIDRPKMKLFDCQDEMNDFVAQPEPRQESNFSMSSSSKPERKFDGFKI